MRRTPIMHRAALIVLCVCFSFPAQGRKSSSFNGLDASLERLDRLSRSPRAAIELWEQRSWLARADRSDRDKLIEAWTRLADDPRAPIALRRLAMQNLQHDAWLRADRPRAEELATRLGWLREWWMLGPFHRYDQNPTPKILTSLDKLDLQATWPGKVQAISWRSLQSPRPDGRMDLHNLLHPEEEIQAFALHRFTIRQAGRYQIFAGCDDACTLWLDGQEILHGQGPFSLQPDQMAAEIELAAGEHNLLLRIEQQTGSMGFVLGLIRSQEPKSIRDFSSLGQWFTRRAETEPESPEALAEAGRALDFAGIESPETGRTSQWLSRALELLPEDQLDRQVRYRLWLARASEDDDLAQRLLHQVLDLKSDCAEAMSRLGLSHHIRGRAPRALHWQNRALQADPNLLSAAVERCEVLMNLGLESLALACSEDLAARHPERPDVLSSAGSLFRQAERWAKATSYYQNLAALRPGDTQALRPLYELALTAGDLERAMNLLKRMQATDPWRLDWPMEQAELELANGRAQQAMETYGRVLDLAPAMARAMEGQAEAYMALARPEEAIKIWRRALQLTPQNRSLERRLLATESQVERFFDSETRDAQRLAAELPPLPGASSERLLDLHVVRLHPNGMTSRYRQQIIRILNSRDAKRLKTMRVEYAPGRQELRILKSRVLRADGSSDSSVVVRDYSLSEPWYNLYYDVHAREIAFPTVKPGDIIELATLVDDVGGDVLFDGTYGDLIALQFSEPVRRVEYVLLAPENLRFHHNQPSGLESQQDAAALPGLTRHRWSAKELPAIEPEVAMPGYTESHRVLHLSSEVSWKNLSRWFHGKIADSLDANTSVRELAKTLTQGLDRPEDRIHAIYRFVADSTRYVGLEFGIHSYVPYAAPLVLKRKFGDCKDKSALLVALFDAVGIKAHLALVRMHRLGAIEPHPASLAVFNHAICYLPDHDLWLDGTATLHSVENLPAQDQGVQALVISEDGTDLRLTPRSSAEQNLTALNFRIRPKENGSAVVDSQIELTGALAPEVRMRYLGGTPQEQLFGQTIREIFPGAAVRSVKADNLRDPSRPLIMRAKIQVPKLGRRDKEHADWPVLGKATSYQSNMASFETRRHDLILGPAWSVRWRVQHDLPGGMRPSELPKAGVISTPFGQAKLALHDLKNSLVVEAELRITAARIKAEDYADFRIFLGRADELFGQSLSFDGGAHARR